MAASRTRDASSVEIALSLRSGATHTNSVASRLTGHSTSSSCPASSFRSISRWFVSRWAGRQLAGFVHSGPPQPSPTAKVSRPPRFLAWSHARENATKHGHPGLAHTMTTLPAACSAWAVPVARPDRFRSACVYPPSARLAAFLASMSGSKRALPCGSGSRPSPEGSRPATAGAGASEALGAGSAPAAPVHPWDSASPAGSV